MTGAPLADWVAAAWLPGVGALVLVALTAAAARARALPRWQVPLGIGWTWVWVEVLLLALFPPPGPMPMVGPAAVWGPLGIATSLDVPRPGDPPGTPVVQVVGDSFAAGVGAPAEGTLVAQLAQAMAPTHPDVVVRDHGRPGAAFVNEVHSFALIDQHAAADVVAWIFVLNDLGISCPDCKDFITQQDRLGALGSPLLRTLAGATLGPGATAAAEGSYHDALAPDTDNWAELEATLPRVVRAVTDRGGRFVFVIFPLMHALDRYPFEDEHRRLAAVAEASGAEVLDLLPAFEGRDARTLWAHPIDHHPNTEGYGIAARAIAGFLGPAPLPDSRGTDCAAPPILLPPGSAAEQRVCGDPSPEALADAAQILLDADVSEEVRTGVFGWSAMELLDLAWVRSDDGAPVRSRLRDLGSRAQQATGYIAPPGPDITP